MHCESQIFKYYGKSDSKLYIKYQLDCIALRYMYESVYAADMVCVAYIAPDVHGIDAQIIYVICGNRKQFPPFQ